MEPPRHDADILHRYWPGVDRLCLCVHAGEFETMNPSESLAVKTSSMSINCDVIIRVFLIILYTTALGGIIFHATTYALQEIFNRRLGDIATTLIQVASGPPSSLQWPLLPNWWSVTSWTDIRHGRSSLSLPRAGAVLFAMIIYLFGAPALIASLAFMLVVFGQIPINDVMIGRVANSEWRSRAFTARSFFNLSVMSLTLTGIA